MSEHTSEPQPSKRAIEEYAKHVAASHVSDGSEETEVYVDWNHGEVRLVEIADHYPDTEEVLPFQFAAQPERGFDYPVVIVLHSQAVWQRHPDKSVLLPHGWNFDSFRRIDEPG